MENAQEAAIGFASKLRPQDLAQVVDFDSRVEIKPGSPTMSTRSRRAIHATSAGGSTALHNAVYIALKELAKIKAKNPDEVRRQAIVVLSDGEDTSSLVTFEEVLELAKRSETAIYTIGLQPRETSALKGFREAEFVLRQLAQETGGRAFFAAADRRAEGRLRPDRRRAVESVLDGLRVENPARRRLPPDRRPGGPPERTARTKRGYYGPVLVVAGRRLSPRP